MPTDPAANAAASLTPRLLVRFLRRHVWLWATPAAAGLVLAALFSVLQARTWEASQGFLIRSEAAGFTDQRLGKFADLSEMKAVQETVLEIARSQTVLIAALEQVGPPPSWLPASGYPSADDVIGLRESMAITPPGGAEFGMTEVFYLTVTANRPERARQLAAAVADQLESRLVQVRKEQAGSLIEELRNGVAAAIEARDAAAARLGVFEAQVGADLAELRALESPVGGQGELTQTAIAIEAALRDNAAERRRNEQLLALLRSAVDSPQRLLATPSTLLASQPALDRLKTGLVNAQINSASLSGTRSERHPMVIAARNREAQQAAELHKEIPLAIAGVELELRLNQQRSLALQEELAAARRRLAGLAGKRAAYSNLVAGLNHHNRMVESAEGQLADARAHQAGAKSSSVLARIDEVESSTHPLGPGRTTKTLAGGIAGLMVGLGLLFSFRSPSELAPPVSASEGIAGPFGSPAYQHATAEWTTPPATAASFADYTTHPRYSR